jgi:cytoskeletal protein RodZ
MFDYNQHKTPRATTSRRIARYKNPFSSKLLYIIFPLLFILIVGAIFIAYSTAQAAFNTNAPVAKNANTALASANTDTTASATTTMATSTATPSTSTMATPTISTTITNIAPTPATNNTNANQNASTAATTSNNTTTATHQTTSTTNKAKDTSTPTQAQSFNCNINGTTVSSCNGSATIQIMSNSTTCALTQGNNLITFNCPSNQTNSQISNAHAQQLTCNVNGTTVNGCNGTVVISIQSSLATCTLATVNNLVTMSCPVARKVQHW